MKERDDDGKDSGPSKATVENKPWDGQKDTRTVQQGSQQGSQRKGLGAIRGFRWAVNVGCWMPDGGSHGEEFRLLPGSLRSAERRAKR